MWCGVAALLAVTLFWRLGEASFWDPDEAHYAQTTRELIQTRDWMAPFYNGEPFFDKPILFYWLQAVPMSSMADPEMGARLAPAVCGVLLAAVTWWFGTRRAGRETGAVAALLLATNAGMFGLARYAILDLPLTAALFGGVAAVVVAMFEQRRRVEYGGYVLIGVATALKGPLAIVLCGVAFILAATVSAGLRRQLLALHWLRGLGIAIALGLPWPLFMLWRFGDAFVDGYILNENLKLYATPMYAGQPGWSFYLGILAVGMLPWTPLLVARAVDQWRRRRARDGTPDEVDTLLWCWAAGIVLFFSFSRFKLDHYVFPAAPALCLIAARAWVQWRHAPSQVTPLLAWGIRAIGPALIAAGLVLAYAALALLALPRGFLVVPGAFLACGAVASLRYRDAARAPAVPWAALVAMGVLYAGAVVWVIPALEREKVVPDVAQWVAGHAGPDDRVASFRLNRWNTAYRFYVNRPVTRVESDEQARRFFSDPRPYYCVMSEELFDALLKAGVPMRKAYVREGRWVTSGRALWRNASNRTRFVVAVPADQAGPAR